MANTDPPSIPRLSPIGWSIDEGSDLHNAVFDIADGMHDYIAESEIDHKKTDQQVTLPDDSPILESRRQLPPSIQQQWPPQKQQVVSDQYRKPLLERSSSGSLANRSFEQSTSTKANNKTLASREYPPRVDRRMPRTIKRPSTSDGAYSWPRTESNTERSVLAGSTSKARGGSNRISSRDTDSDVDMKDTKAQNLTEPKQEQNLSRSSSLFKLKRPFRRKKAAEEDEDVTTMPQVFPKASIQADSDMSIVPSDSDIGAQPTKSSKSSNNGSSSGRGFSGFKDLMLTSSRKSNSSSRHESMSGQSGRASSDLDSVAAVKQKMPGNRPNGISISHHPERQYDEGTPQNRKLSVSPLPNSSLASSSGGAGESSGTHSNLATPTSSIRRKVRPPQAQAPSMPLPPPPTSLPIAAPAVVVGQCGDPADEVEDLLFTPSTHKAPSPRSTDISSDGNGRDTVRKVKSQSSLRLLRKPSMLVNLRANSFTKEQPPEDISRNMIASPLSSSPSPTASRRIAKEMPWEIVQPSKYGEINSSPEVERLSLSHTDDSRELTSSPSLEEARRALSPSTPAEQGIPTSNALAIPTNTYANGQSASRLDSSGGAAGLFGSSGGSSGGSGSNVRPRTSSLLPWRSRSNSQAAHREGSVSPSTPFSRSMGDGTFSSQQSQPPAQKEVKKMHKLDIEQFKGDSDAFVRQVMKIYPREDVPAVLASASDDLHKTALRIFMQRFLFTGHPLDVALRKLLMTLCLPKETQQIDRVMEAFARRYNECNENLFESDDQPYMLAFSLMMLHTDTFNKNAKQKMSKADYVRNTSASGVATEILEYLYDNLTFTQFIYVEDEAFLHRRKSENDTTAASVFKSAFTSSSSASKARVDPYHIIVSGQTHTLRPDVHIDEDSPFSAKGTKSSFDIEYLLQTFTNSPSIEIITAQKTSLPPATAGFGGYYATLPSISKDEEAIVTLRITKVGCVGRKDDMDDKKKSQSRKWKTCGMILSSSQLLFFRDLVWTSALDQRITEQMAEQPNKEGGVLITPRITYFKPDGVLALGDAIAVKDSTYSKYKHVFRLVTRHGDVMKQYLIQTPNEEEMNDWIHKINFCGAFRSAGLRVNGMDVSRDASYSNPASPAGVNITNGNPSDVATPSSSSSSVIPPMSPSTVTSMNSGEDPPTLRKKLNARFRQFKPVVEKMTKNLEKHEKLLDEKLRLARHLTIATPFSKVTRDRIEGIATVLAQEIRQLRLDVARYACRREILILELEEAERTAKANSPPGAFDGHQYDEDDDAWQAATSLSLTPRDTSSRSGSLSISRASSFSQSRSGSNSFVGDPNVPVPKLPPPAMSFGTKANEKAANAESEMATPTMKMIGLQEPSAHPEKEHGSMGHRSKFHFGTSSPSAKHHHHNSPNEEAMEMWDRTKMGKNDKRVSLVNLPDPHQWQALTPRLAMNASLIPTPTSSPPQKDSHSFHPQPRTVLNEDVEDLFR
ncbi:uncharacterized protein FA14DRAFT_178285 [Meira miltonrushii]|uniref:SEC7 domain-containing protein n=1 Tax=Meira miltonrushii TaxID=1280837 RepID=A0A316VBN9_9BASI|nr:uncharacterized protein FA14DRAFT_178285 [Meira miltonrushii]PWN34890.1 hypothetical protein FA14DRAFT_178285 [Meira miltonrushii]